MGGMVVLLIVGAVVLAIVIRVFAGSADHDRIRAEVEGRGGTVVSITWQPFGKGWYGEQNDRIYEVLYTDRVGRERRAWCKTSALSGVYFSEDEPPELSDLGGDGARAFGQ